MNHNDGTEIPILRDVVSPGRVSVAMTTTHTRSETRELMDTAPSPDADVNGAHTDTDIAIASSETIRDLIERAANELGQELDSKFELLVRHNLEDALRRSLDQFRDHARASIIDQLMQRLPELAASLRASTADGANQT